MDNNDANNTNDSGLRGGQTTPLNGDSKLSSNLFLKQPPDPKKPNASPVDVKADNEILIKSILSALLTQTQNQTNFFTYVKSYHKTHLKKLDEIISEIKATTEDKTLGRSKGATSKLSRKGTPKPSGSAGGTKASLGSLERQLGSLSKYLAKSAGKSAGGLTDALLPFFGGVAGTTLSGFVSKIAGAVFSPTVLAGAGAFAGSFLVTRKVLDMLDKDHVIDGFMKEKVWDKLPDLKIGNFKVGEALDKGLQNAQNWATKQWTGVDNNAPQLQGSVADKKAQMLKSGKLKYDENGKLVVNKGATKSEASNPIPEDIGTETQKVSEYAKKNNIKAVSMASLGLKGTIASCNSIPAVAKSSARNLVSLDRKIASWGYSFTYTSAMGGGNVHKMTPRGHQAGVKVDMQIWKDGKTGRVLTSEQENLLKKHGYIGNGALGWEAVKGQVGGGHYDFHIGSGARPFEDGKKGDSLKVEQGSPTGFASPISVSNILDMSKGSTASGMSMSKEGLHALKNEEGVRTQAYKDSKGIWTIGVGHTGQVNGQAIHAGMKITNEQVDQLLKGDIKRAEDYVRRNVKVPITQEMFDALVSYVFNVGSCPKLMQKLNNKDYKGAMAEIQTKNPELNKRRGREQAMFAKGIAKMQQDSPTIASSNTVPTSSSVPTSNNIQPTGVAPQPNMNTSIASIPNKLAGDTKTISSPEQKRNPAEETSSISIGFLRMVEGVLQQ